MRALDRIFPPDQCDPDAEAKWWTAHQAAAAQLEVPRPAPTSEPTYCWQASPWWAAIYDGRGTE